VAHIDPDKLTASLRRLTEHDGGDTRRAVDEVVRACVDLFTVDGSGLMIADPQNTLRYLTSSDAPGHALEDAQSETGQGPCVDTFVYGHPVHTDDMAAETRWPRSRDTIAEHGVRAVLGVPVRLGGVTVGSLNVYRSRPHAWDASEQDALTRYGAVVEATLEAILAAHTAGELAEQLQYALDNRITIERAVGFVMARLDIDPVSAFDVLRRAARRERRKVAEVAQDVLESGRPPANTGA
jgi:GAF domain-containing protein